MVDRLRRTGPRPHRPHRLRPRAAGHRLGGSGVGLARRQRPGSGPAPVARHAAEHGALHLAHRHAGTRAVARGPSLPRIARRARLRTGIGRGRRGRRHRTRHRRGRRWGRVVTRHGNGGRLRRHRREHAPGARARRAGRGGALPGGPAGDAGARIRPGDGDRPGCRRVRAGASREPERHRRSRSATSRSPGSSSDSPSTHPAGSGPRAVRTSDGTACWRRWTRR